MKNASKSTKQAASLTLSRAEFEKISAIEGIYLSDELAALLNKYMADGLSHADCRRKIIQHFKSKAA